MLQQTKVLENEHQQILCKSHQLEPILFSYDYQEKFEDRLFCKQCLSTRGKPHNWNSFEDIIQELQTKRLQAIQEIQEIKSQLLLNLQQLNQDIQIIQKDVLSKINQIQNECQEWISQITTQNEQQLNSLDIKQLLKQYSNELNQQIKTNIVNINIKFYQSLYKKLNTLTFYNQIESLQESLQKLVVINLKQIKQQQVHYINAICKVHNQAITNINLLDEEQDIESRLKCPDCKMGYNPISVNNFIKICDQYNVENNEALQKKQLPYLQKINVIKQLLKNFRKQQNTFLEESLQELDFKFVEENNIDKGITFKINQYLQNEDVITLINQVQQWSKQSYSKEMDDMDQRIIIFNKLLLEKSKIINDLFIELKPQIQTNIKDTISEQQLQNFEFEKLSTQLTNSLNKIQDSINSRQQIEEKMNQEINLIKSQLCNIQENQNNIQAYFKNRIRLTQMDGIQLINNYYVYSMAINFNNQLLACSYDSKIQIREINNYKLTNPTITLETGYNDNYYIYAMLFSKKYDWLFVCPYSSICLFKKISNDNWGQPYKFDKAHKNWIRCILLNKEETNIISCSEDYKIKNWLVFWNKNKIIFANDFQGKQHTDKIYCIQYNFEEDHIISSGQDKLIILWKKKNQNCWEFQQYIQSQYQGIGIRISFINHQSFILQIQEKECLLFLQSYKKKQLFIFNCNYKKFNSIFIQKTNILILKQANYVYFFKLLTSNGKLQIACDPLNVRNDRNIGAATSNGDCFISWNSNDKQLRLYKMDYF